MSRLKEPKPVYLFTAIIYKPDSELSACIKTLNEELGETDFESSELSFEGTAYYESEMGKLLKRKFITFNKLIARDKLKDIKVFTNSLEEKFLETGNRTINIDPGYIALEHVILATGKGFAHRPYLGKGVYADLTLIYRGNEYTALEWTYPDYGGAKRRSLFQTLRRKYVGKLGSD